MDEERQRRRSEAHYGPGTTPGPNSLPFRRWHTISLSHLSNTRTTTLFSSSYLGYTRILYRHFESVRSIKSKTYSLRALPDMAASCYATTYQSATATTTVASCRGMSQDRKVPRCDGCRLTESELKVKLKRCAGCSATMYCSRECQKQDWLSSHKWVFFSLQIRVGLFLIAILRSRALADHCHLGRYVVPSGSERLHLKFSTRVQRTPVSSMTRTWASLRNR